MIGSMSSWRIRGLRLLMVAFSRLTEGDLAWTTQMEVQPFLYIENDLFLKSILIFTSSGISNPNSLAALAITSSCLIFYLKFSVLPYFSSSLSSLIKVYSSYSYGLSNEYRCSCTCS